MKVIFLDIDGVLNTAETELQSNTIVHIDEFRVKYLKMIVERTGAKIVLTSSNKNHFKKVNDKVVSVSDEDCYAPDFINILNKYNLSLYDVIPTIKDSSGREFQRQDEIKVWLSWHEDVEGFVILYDETTMLMDFVGTNLIKLNNLPVGVLVRNMEDCIGLCEEHIEQAVDILNNKNLVKGYVKKKIQKNKFVYGKL